MNIVIKTYRDLIVWQKAMALVTEVYRISKNIPTSEIYGLTSQMRRCAVSIPSNIAEGYGRHSTNDYVRFLQIASGSLYELQTQLEISVNLEYFKKSENERLLTLTGEIERMLSGLIRKLNNRK
ncbi:MAG: four helix bundle protein [Kiritimatiellia bacterium]|nr:four helix bundle protein [Kiritimatiellia bacterium]